MKINVGIDPFLGYLSYHNAVNESTVDVKIKRVSTNENEKVQQMFEEIKSKINETELGCACICLNYIYDNEIRKRFVAEGLKNGFVNVEIINYNTALYLKAISYINFEPLNGNVIWIRWGRSIYVWQMNDQKAKFIGSWDTFDLKVTMGQLQKIIDESKMKIPNIIFLYKHDNDTTIYRKISDSLQFVFYDFNKYWASRACLLKSGITRSDNELAHLNALIFLSAKITLKIEDKKIISFNEGHQLPINYEQKFIKESSRDVLEISSGHILKETVVIPNYDEVQLTFEIDSNEIYLVTFNKLPAAKDVIYGEKDQITPDVISFEMADKTMESALLRNSNFFTSNIPLISTRSNDDKEVVGIDLGTSRCCAAVNRKNGITTIPLDNTGERLLPSFVSYDEESVKCGKVVFERLRNYSKSTVFDSKRIIGKKFGDIVIDLFWPYGLTEINGKVFIEIRKFNGNNEPLVNGLVSAEEVAADLLKHIKQKSDEFRGKKLTKAVITVPATFDIAQKIATTEAAKNAGWDEIILLPEPIAAAFAYFIDRPILNDSVVLLFDLGGGTLDVSIFNVDNNQIKVISNTGDTTLGGRDFDTVLINYFKNALNTKYGVELSRSKKYLLMTKCQIIKEGLSSLKSCNLDIDDFDPFQDGMISINRKEFEKMCEPLLNKVRNTLVAALYNSNLNANQINKVLLVGGGSRMPMIKILLQKTFPDSAHSCEENPDEVVAMGAAYYAQSIY